MQSKDMHTMRVDLQGTAIVTGGAHGIGRAIAETLARNGATVIIVDKEKDAGIVAAKEISELSYRCLFMAGDVSNATQIKSVVKKIASRFHNISILINNAGINTTRNRKPIHEYSAEDWHTILATDLTGVFNTSRAVIPYMLTCGNGRIINIASVAGLVPLRLQSAFVAAKAGVANLTRSMALELGPLGILVNAVAPGSILTRATEALFYGADGAYTEKAKSLLSHIPLGRPGMPQEVANAVLFLVSPDASYVNGHVFVIDGGWIAGYSRDW